MKLTPPFPLNTIVQRFGANAVPMYSGMGLKGHPGIDFGVSWGTSIPCAVDSYCYLTVLNKDPAFYQDVATIVEDETGIYEIIYGHLSTIQVQSGTQLKQGDIIGNVGNTGTVYSMGMEVSESAKLDGSHAGSHLHFQVRVLSKEIASQTQDPTKHYVNDGTQQLIINGFRYYVPNFSNGYNGCIDPAPFFDEIIQTIKDEVQVLNQATDPAVKRSFIALILSQIRKLLGF